MQIRLIWSAGLPETLLVQNLDESAINFARLTFNAAGFVLIGQHVEWQHVQLLIVGRSVKSAMSGQRCDLRATCNEA
jgi:predicted thioesterase